MAAEAERERVVRIGYCELLSAHTIIPPSSSSPEAAAASVRATGPA